jgi:cytidylate kinase/CBS domain-containing protein
MAIITISRGSLSGGARLAEQLGTRLGAKVISREVIVEAARKYGVSENELTEGIKSPPGLWDRLTHHKHRYLLAIQATLAEMVMEGNTIYHGHAGHLLLKELPHVIKLRLIAPLEYRAQAAMAELKGGREEALHHIQMIDEQRAKWVRLIYNVEWTDPALYDLILNLEQMSIETACETVVNLVGRKEYCRTPETVQMRKDFALATRVRAELTFHSGFSESAIEVTVRRGILRFSGSHYEKNKDAVLDFVKNIPWVKEALPSESEGSGAPAGSVVEEKKAADVMLPISSYPYIHHWVTIREAIAALNSSSVKLTDGHVIRPRYILVHDEQEELVGVLARRNLLRGLTPQFKEMERARERMEELGAPMTAFSIPESFHWLSFFGATALSHAEEPVASIIAPIRCTVGPDDDLSTVVTTMLQHNVDLVPVVSNRKTVGVILMTDVFDTIAEHLMENRTPPLPPQSE